MDDYMGDRHFRQSPADYQDCRQLCKCNAPTSEIAAFYTLGGTVSDETSISRPQRSAAEPVEARGYCGLLSMLTGLYNGSAYNYR